jgi:hypothetical protein
MAFDLDAASTMVDMLCPKRFSAVILIVAGLCIHGAVAGSIQVDNPTDFSLALLDPQYDIVELTKPMELNSTAWKHVVVTRCDNGMPCCSGTVQSCVSIYGPAKA